MTLTRRSLFQAAAVSCCAGLATQTLGTRMAFASGAYTGDTLVVLSLRGGFDGLSAVVPAGDPEYYKARPSIAVPKASLIPVDSFWGLHPALAPIKPLWTSGQMGAVVAVGQPDLSRSHFAATEEMERAAPGSTIRTGWLDRALGLRSVGTVFQAAQVGDSSPGQQLLGGFQELSLGEVDSFALDAVDGSDAVETRRWETALHDLYAHAPGALAFPAGSALKALAGSRTVRSYSAAASYDTGSDLAMALKDVARLIKSGVGLQVAAVDYGDWDMHAGLGAAGGGWMATKLAELAKALAAFAADLGSLLGKVTVVTVSEFGRRVAQNASGGVDHGHGGTMLVLGGNVNGNKVHGRWPGLAPSQLVSGDLRATTDYRQVLAEVLQERCQQPGMSTVFPGLPSGVLGVTR